MPRVPREPNPPGTRMPCGIVEQARAAFFLERLGLDPVQSHLQVVARSRRETPPR